MISRLRSTLTTPEIRHLIARLLLRPILTAPFIWDWSRWRRQHQAAAAIAHRKTRQYMQLQYWPIQVREVCSQALRQRIPRRNF
jgi:hypothetical protein